ncbi:cytochrome c peroxidase [Candidatus Accumulibacter sp. ACC003]|uniref:c-type cytochrome n=1 Tax=Candidatus Accumulibacter sp. ACC003 TaxID=2823334 RepID=UPI0025BDD783|nr:cytochrome c peroxidase [Candidatus Accumulibacter sp. ACC003]
MNPHAKPLALVLALAGGLTLPMAATHAANPCKPAAAKAANPCAAKNPCAASNGIDPQLVTRPKNYRRYVGDAAELSSEGKRLWSDSRLSTNGMSCNTCHQANSAFQNSFAQPYPHRVQMAQDNANMKTIHLDEMVQICMVAPMAAKPLAWNSKQLAALTAYTAEVQKTFKPTGGGANPCAAKNPCAVKN